MMHLFYFNGYRYITIGFLLTDVTNGGDNYFQPLAMTADATVITGRVPSEEMDGKVYLLQQNAVCVECQPLGRLCRICL